MTNQPSTQKSERALVKPLMQNLLSRRRVWFLLGATLFPLIGFVSSKFCPSAKEAMGIVGFYEEERSFYTFLGDHSYSLRFGGDRAKFIKFVRRMSLDEHKISENKFLETGNDWERWASFTEGDALKGIEYYSSSH